MFSNKIIDFIKSHKKAIIIFALIVFIGFALISCQGLANANGDNNVIQIANKEVSQSVQKTK